jgi:hypothetical protein
MGVQGRPGVSGEEAPGWRGDCKSKWSVSIECCVKQRCLEPETHG